MNKLLPFLMLVLISTGCMQDKKAGLSTGAEQYEGLTSEVRIHNNVPALYINGELTSQMLGAPYRLGESHFKDFLDAGVHVREHLAEYDLDFGCYHLFALSIELCLKAFLRGRGHSVEELKKDFRHNLEALIKEARRRRLGMEVELTRREVRTIVALNRMYSRRNFEEAIAHAYELPPLDAVQEIARKLVEQLKDFTYRTTNIW